MYNNNGGAKLEWEILRDLKPTRKHIKPNQNQSTTKTKQNYGQLTKARNRRHSLLQRRAYQFFFRAKWSKAYIKVILERVRGYIFFCFWHVVFFFHRWESIRLFHVQIVISISFMHMQWEFQYLRCPGVALLVGLVFQLLLWEDWGGAHAAAHRAKELLVVHVLQNSGMY